MRRSMAVQVACVLSFTLPARGQVQEPPQDSAEAAFAARFGGMFQPMAGFDWDEEAERVRVAAEQLWQRNGWTDESDVFAREVAVEVTRIPPWDVAARLNLLKTRVAERYGLDEARSAQLQRSIIREAAGFLLRNSPALLEHGNEALRARAEGRPYTAEQVQRWAKALDPLMNDARASVDRLAREIEPGLSPDKKELFRRDMESFEKRAGYVDRMKTRWAEGKWTPEDWGMEKDPIQTGALRPASPASAASGSSPSGGPPAIVPTIPPGRSDPMTPTELTITPEPPGSGATLPTRWIAHDPKTWIAYVLHVEKRFAFDAGQKTTAASIHAELYDRATDYLSAHRAELSAVPHAQRAQDPRYAPVVALFEELQRRLEALPTTRQRDGAE